MRRRITIVGLAAVGLAACGHGTAAGDRTKVQPPAPEPKVTVAKAGHDWAMFGVEVGKSSVFRYATGITAGNAHRLRRRRVALPGTVDSSPIYLHAARVRGQVRPVLIVTTTYGRTLALSAPTGRVLWTFTPRSYRSYAGSAQFTTSSPVADAARAYVYTTSPDGRVHKLRIADGRD